MIRFGLSHPGAFSRYAAILNLIAVVAIGNLFRE
jgi:hypothetical protein